MLKIIKSLKQNQIIIFIALLAAVLRFYRITETPASLNWDEISHGYNAYSVLKTGRDEWGRMFPLIFQAYGDYKLPVYIYLASISVGIFGLNAFAVRLPSVLAGIAIVVLSYLLSKELFENEKEKSMLFKYRKEIALLSSLLVAIEPWTLFLSRGAFEANIGLAIFLAGAYLALLGLKKPNNLIFSGMFFGLTLWTYNSFRVFIPLILAVSAFIFRHQLSEIFHREKKIFFASIFVFLIFFVPFLIQMTGKEGRVRYAWVAIVNEGAIYEIIQNRQNSNLPDSLNRLVYNRYIYFISKFSRNMLSHVSGRFIFVDGGSHYQFSVPATPLMYLVDYLFFAIGFGVLLVNRFKSKALSVVSMILLLGSVASSITKDSPHVLRAITMLPAPMILASTGFYTIQNALSSPKINLIFRKLLTLFPPFLYVFILLNSLIGYQKKYFNDYRNNYSWAWQYGYKSVVDYIRGNYDNFDKIIITKKYGEPHEFLLFYWPWDPAKYQKDSNLIRFEQARWSWVDSFDKFYFVNDWDIPKEEWQNFVMESGGKIDCSNLRCLLITSPDNYPKTWHKLKTIYFLDGNLAFELLENK